MDIKSCNNRLVLIENGNINDNSERYNKTIVNFKGELKNHQKSLLASMHKIEENQLDNDNESIFTNIGICGDITGSGKSITMLALLCTNPVYQPKEKLTQQFGTYVYVKSKINKNFISSNLIVVPHSCFSQWILYIKDFTSLHVEIINKRKHIDNFDYKKLEFNNTLVLCTNTMYNEFISMHNITWSRVIFDEADSIKIPATIAPNSNFVWFISSSLQNILFPSGTYFEKTQLPNSSRQVITKKYIDGIKKTGYIRDTFRTFERYDADDIINKIVVKNNDNFVKQSFNLTEPIVNIIECRTPSYLHMLIGVINDDIIQLLNAGNIEGAIDKIGCTVENEDNIIEIVTRNFNIRLNNLKREINYIYSLEYERELDIENKQKKISLLQINIDNIEHKINSINTRLKTFENDICNICIDDYVKPTVLKCCQKVYCFSCITRSMKIKNTCPNCRENISISDTLVIGNKNTTCNKLPNKEDALINLLKSKPNGKFLIFSSHDQSFVYIENALKTINHEFVKLLGSIGKINTIIHNFKHGNTNVLMLNANHYGTGLNLENTTDLIFYHKMSPDMEKQVIGRAQRVGRTSVLNIHYLYQENEFT
jgi:hypothetical protein